MSTAVAESLSRQAPDESAHAQHQTMQCMEVRGGNQRVDAAFSMPGVEAWVYSRPYHAAGESEEQVVGGGDVHYVSSCATGRVTRLLVADVSGHGAAVCDAAGGLRGLMQRYVNYIDQTEFVRAMNRQFVAMSADNCFATAVVMTFFAPTRTLAISNAGHPPPLWYRAKRAEWEYLELRRAAAAPALSNIPLGVEDVAQYQQFEVTLEPGDLVLGYTDSLIESRDTNGDLLGPTGLMRIARTLAPTDVSRLIVSLLAAVRAEHAGNLDADDVTALLFRPTGAGENGPPLRRLLSPLRVARAILTSWLRGKSMPAPLPEFSLTNIGGAWFAPLNRLGGKRRDVTADAPPCAVARH